MQKNQSTDGYVTNCGAFERAARQVATGYSQQNQHAEGPTKTRLSQRLLICTARTDETLAWLDTKRIDDTTPLARISKAIACMAGLRKCGS